MTEVESQSGWVGKILTCSQCLRSFKVEAGDSIYKGYFKHSKKVRIHQPDYFKLPCGHHFLISEKEIHCCVS